MWKQQWEQMQSSVSERKEGQFSTFPSSSFAEKRKKKLTCFQYVLRWQCDAKTRQDGSKSDWETHHHHNFLNIFQAIYLLTFILSFQEGEKNSLVSPQSLYRNASHHIRIEKTVLQRKKIKGEKKEKILFSFRFFFQNEKKTPYIHSVSLSPDLFHSLHLLSLQFWLAWFLHKKK